MTANASPALCYCGVMAIGRCNRCDSAFCLSHQARDYNNDYVDLCQNCKYGELVTQGAELRKKHDQATLERVHHEHEMVEALRNFASAMEAAGRPGVRSIWTTKWKKVQGWELPGSPFPYTYSHLGRNDNQETTIVHRQWYVLTSGALAVRKGPDDFPDVGVRPNIQRMMLRMVPVVGEIVEVDRLAGYDFSYRSLPRMQAPDPIVTFPGADAVRREVVDLARRHKVTLRGI